MKYPMFKVHMPVNDALKGIEHVLQSGFINEGLQVKEFETSLSDYLGVKNLILVNSCTSALTLAYVLADVGADTSVISPSMTCIATNTPIVNLNSRIIWADINSQNGNVDHNGLEALIEEDTRAIVSVSWAGSPPNLEAIDNIAKKHGLYHIHDGAHAFGALYKGRPISDFADFTCFSFQAIKHISTGDGGALICRDDNKFLLAKKLKWFGYDRDATKDEKGEWKGQRWSADIGENEIGFKFNMNNLAGAIGLCQLEHVDKILDGHRRNADIYNKIFSGSDSIKPAEQESSALSSYWVFTCLLTGMEDKRDLLVEKLNDEGIGAGLVHVPNHTYSAFKENERQLPGTEFFASNQISLPCGWWLSEQDCELIANTVLKTIKKLV